MPDLRELKDEDLQGLTPEAVTALAQQMLQRVREHDLDLEQRDQRIERQAQEIRLKDAKLEKLTFELARHKAWKVVGHLVPDGAALRAVSVSRLPFVHGS
ncbi:hypothetical protein J7E70_30670 [Variovorax paradoxus]|nr:hypothetical protein [Variovorax paradoxus]MBT2304785.1 hypothetical protein [Variovorax paradoxus]